MSSRIRLLIVEDMPQVANYLRAALAVQAEITIVDVATDGAAGLQRIEAETPDVVIVDQLLGGAVRPAEIVARLRELGIPAVVLTVPNKNEAKVDPERGIAAVLKMPFLAHDVVRAIHQAYESTWATAAARRSVVAVYGPRGGVGRTTIALNLAAACASAGHRTLLIDGSFQFGDLRSLLGAPDAPSILDLPTDAIEEDDLRTALHRHTATAVEFLLAPPRIEQAELVTPRDVEKTIAHVRGVYDVTVVDLPVALSETTLAFLDLADTIAVVVAEDPAALANGAAILRTFEALRYPEAKRRVVLNRAGPGGPAPETAAVLGAPVDHAILGDAPTVLAAAAERIPFVTLQPDARVSRDVAAPAEALVGAPGPASGLGSGERGRAAAPGVTA